MIPIPISDRNDAKGAVDSEMVILLSKWLFPEVQNSLKNVLFLIICNKSKKKTKKLSYNTIAAKYH